MCCTRLTGNAGSKISPSGHHRTTLLGYIFTTKARIGNRGKNLLNSNISSTSTYPHDIVNFGPLAAEICWQVWGKFQRVLLLRNVTARHSLNRGRHLYSAGRPSCWALAHILLNCYLWMRAMPIILKACQDIYALQTDLNYSVIHASEQGCYLGA